MDEPKHVAKRWHEAYDDILEAYTPSKQLPPERLLAETDAPFQYLKGEKFTAPSEIVRVYQAMDCFAAGSQ